MSVKIKITKPGLYNGDGDEIPVGTELDLKAEPTAWAGRYEVIGGNKGGKTPVTNPKAEA